MKKPKNPPANQKKAPVTTKKADRKPSASTAEPRRDTKKQKAHGDDTPARGGSLSDISVHDPLPPRSGRRKKDKH